MPQLSEIAGDLQQHIPVPYMAAGVAGGTPWVVPYNSVITAMKWVPAAAITANGTNYFTLSFFNRGAAGAGTVEVATARSLAATNGAKAVPEPLTLSATAANLLLAAADVLNVELASTGSGLICPGGIVAVTYRLR